MSLTKVRLFVTDKDIREGKKCNGNLCMAARAISRKIKPDYCVEVGLDYAKYYQRNCFNEIPKRVYHPTFLVRKIETWDNGGKINRFNCMIEIPTECLK